MGKRICWWLGTVKIFEYFFVSSLSHYHQFKVFNPSLIWCGQKLIILIKSPPSSEFNAIQSELSAEFIGWYRLDTLINFIMFDYREDDFFWIFTCVRVWQLDFGWLPLLTHSNAFQEWLFIPFQLIQIQRWQCNNKNSYVVKNAG